MWCGRRSINVRMFWRRRWLRLMGSRCIGVGLNGLFCEDRFLELGKETDIGLAGSSRGISAKYRLRETGLAYWNMPTTPSHEPRYLPSSDEAYKQERAYCQF